MICSMFSSTKDWESNAHLNHFNNIMGTLHNYLVVSELFNIYKNSVVSLFKKNLFFILAVFYCVAWFLWLFICCKTKLKKKIFFLNYIFFTKYTLFAEKMFLHGKKKFYIEHFFLLKKNFFTEKNVNKNVKIYI